MRVEARAQNKAASAVGPLGGRCAVGDGKCLDRSERVELPMPINRRIFHLSPAHFLANGVGV
jgi:hypothetical protein